MEKRPKYGYASRESAVNGIINFIENNYPVIMTDNSTNTFVKINTLCIDFLKLNELPYKEGNKESILDYNANKVQDNWKLFKEFLKSKNTNP